MGIRAIVSGTFPSLFSILGLSPTFFNELGVEYLHLPIKEFEGPTMEQMKTFIEFSFNMERVKRPLLVHCKEGIGRTGTLLHLYFLSRGFSLQEAKHLLLDKRPQCLLLKESQQTALLEYMRTSKLQTYLQWKSMFSEDSK